MLGASGPLALLPLQRLLLRRLAFDLGATRGGVQLARQAVAKAASQEVLGDVAELLNLRSYARTYVSSRPRVLKELEEALQHAAEAVQCVEGPPEATAVTPLRGMARARLLLGRTLTWAAHSLALAYVQGPMRDRLLARWGSPLQMFQLAEKEPRAQILLVFEAFRMVFACFLATFEGFALCRGCARPLRAPATRSARASCVPPWASASSARPRVGRTPRPASTACPVAAC